MGKILTIITPKDKRLTAENKLVQKFDTKLHQIIEDMSKTLNAQTDPQGVGLAAPQVGINLRCFIIKPTPESPISTFINPQILETSYAIKKSSHKKNLPLEGCLSLNNIWGPVDRADRVLLSYFTVNGEKKTEWFSGFKAVIIQHEVDHLSGVLFTQRSLEQKKHLYEEVDGKLEKLGI